MSLSSLPSFIYYPAERHISFFAVNWWKCTLYKWFKGIYKFQCLIYCDSDYSFFCGNKQYNDTIVIFNLITWLCRNQRWRHLAFGMVQNDLAFCLPGFFTLKLWIDWCTFSPILQRNILNLIRFDVLESYMHFRKQLPKSLKEEDM